ncbi:MAG: hypothetical protein QXU18_11115, partial [Thermoplasmatales archaeon]
KFKIEYHVRFSNFKIWDIFYKGIGSVMNTGSFMMMSKEFVEKNKSKIFDETFINVGEDVDLALRIRKMKENVSYVDYSIGDTMGGTLGTGIDRILRDVVNKIYLEDRVCHYGLDILAS